MASIVKKEIKKGIQFQVRYRIDGRQKTKTFTSKNKTITAIREAERQAKRFAKEIEAKIELELVKDETEMTFHECMWRVYKMKFQHYEDTTIKNYTTYINLLSEYFGDKKIKNITSVQIEDFLNYFAKDHSNRTITLVRGILRNTFEYAESKGVDNPIPKVKFIMPRETDKKTMPINEDDIHMLLSSIKTPKYKHLSLFLLYTGKRVGEAQALTWDDIDYENRIITINKSYQRTNKVRPTKMKKEHVFPLYQTLRELFEEVKMYQQENKRKFGPAYEENNLVFCNEDGSYLKYSAIKSYFSRLDKKLGTKIRPHRFRHTFASALILRKGVSPKIVQKLLDHDNVTTTLDVYADLFDNRYDEKTYEDLDNAFQNRTTNVQQVFGKNVN